MKLRLPLATSRAGFTLLEVLVASVVLAIVLAILLGTLTTSMSLWRNTEGKIAADREGRSADLLLADDLMNAVMPANRNLWPRTNNGSLQFLTARPRDYQGTSSADVGDVCFVEYQVDAANSTLTRRFLASRETFDDIITAGQFPSPSSQDSQLLAVNVMKGTADAVRGFGLAGVANPANFVVLNTNMIALTGAYSTNNPPTAIEVNLAVADPTSMEPENKAIWEANTSVVLRNAGIYSFRVSLPNPPPSP